MFKNLFLFLCCSWVFLAQAQMPNAQRIQSKLPPGTKVLENIPYQADTLKKHLLDLYLPAKSNGKSPLLIFVHGGGWIGNDKYSDMGYMSNTIADVLNQGFAIASIDYRFATQAVFPGILQDCNRAASYLYDSASRLGLDPHNFFLMGFSAGGHLASLMGTSQNNQVEAFYVPNTMRPLRYRAVIDYYGPTDLLLFPGNDDEQSPESKLIGVKPLERPDLAAKASPITYIDKNDPPFLIFHGEKDALVSNKHSKLFSAWLGLKGVSNQLYIVPAAPHFGKMYDVEDLREKVLAFLKQHRL